MKFEDRDDMPTYFASAGTEDEQKIQFYFHNGEPLELLIDNRDICLERCPNALKQYVRDAERFVQFEEIAYKALEFWERCEKEDRIAAAAEERHAESCRAGKEKL